MIRKIGIDLDNTVFDCTPLYRSAFRGSPFTYYHPTDWDVYKCYPKPIADTMIKLFKSPCLYSMEPINENIPYAINKIAKTHDCYITTARYHALGEKQAKAMTIEQLEINGIMFPADKIIITPHSKIQTFKNIDIDLVFDDSPGVIEDCLNNGIDCVMISREDTPYNHYLRSKVSWKANLVEAIKSKQL